ncbi:hypothetical protein KTE69_16885 [Burkholderia multivorans]|uniref:hypothetical protein n=1 Tax=Burkholderia multivorans TaxID=87883 RepID=UPI001C221E83|nr:hypothetical protein [Burkholderia multivorans]MBU9370036.1 hypothetical protein [Burkholderia multivorans]
MSRLEEVREELEQLGKEIELDAHACQGPAIVKGASNPCKNVCLQLFLPPDLYPCLHVKLKISITKCMNDK